VALEHASDGTGRLVRPVPSDGTFWLEDTLPVEVREMSGTPKEIGFEAGMLPDSCRHPHRGDDVVAHKLQFIRHAPDANEINGKLAGLARESLYDVWPHSSWATPLSLYADIEVASMACFRGRIDRVIPRDAGSPCCDLAIANTILYRIPYAAHRMHGDRGVGFLFQKKNLNSCILLLGLARPHVFGGHHQGNDVPECAILLLRAFPG